MIGNKKNLVTVVFSALAGALFGGLVVGFSSVYFLGNFYSDGSALASSNQLNFNIWALESIRNGNNAKSIEQLETEARINLVTVGAYEEHVSSATSDAILRSISNAKQYFDKHPFEYMDGNEKMLIEQAYSKVELSSHNKSLKNGTREERRAP